MLYLLQNFELGVWIYVLTKHQKHWDVFACLIVDFYEVKSRLLSEVTAKEEADEAFDFSVKSFRMETANYAESDYVWIYYILLHFLALGEFLFLVDLKLCVLCNTLNDCERNLLVLISITHTEVFKDIFIVSLSFIDVCLGILTGVIKYFFILILNRFLFFFIFRMRILGVYVRSFRILTILWRNRRIIEFKDFVELLLKLILLFY